MDDFESRLSTLLRDAVPEPRREFHADDIVDVRTRRFPPVAPILAVALIVAVAIGLAIARAGSAHPHTTALPNGGGSSNSSGGSPAHGINNGEVTGSTDDPNYAPALERATQALATVPILPGAVHVDTAPVRSLEGPSTIEMNGNLIDKAEFWTAPGTVAAAVAYFHAHQPAHATVGDSGSTSDSQYLSYTLGTSHQPGSPLVNLDVTPYEDGVAVRVDVEVLWYSTKPTSEIIGTVTSVDITLERPAGGGHGSVPNIHRTLTGTAAQHLAAAVDAAKIGDASVHSCPPGTGATDRLLFHATNRLIDVTNFVDSCQGMLVTTDGKQQPTLLGSIDPLVLASLGLPASYGR